MKKLALFIIISTTFFGCSDDFLEVPLEDSTSAEEFFTTQEHAIEATNSIYRYQIEWFTSGFPYMIITQIPSDDSDKGSNPGDAAFINDFDNFTINSSAFIVDNYWTGQYRAINFCNQVLTNVSGISMDETLKNRLLAEAKFFRGYHYFNLIRAFGGVPIYTEIPENGVYNIPRNSVEEVYQQAIQDLTEAAAVLPISYDASNVGRATKGAAKGMLAKIAMYRKDWGEALVLSQEVMGMGYDLFPDYYQLFRYQNEYNIESIFEIESTADGNCQADSQYGQTQGVRAQFGWGFNSPSEDLANSYETGDLRRDATILFVGETTPEGDLITAGNNPVHPIRYNQKVYVPSTDFRRNNCRENADTNIKVLRFAEILLINAEANNELGNTMTALESLNRVRNRAGLANSNTTDQTILRMEIWKERRAELALEGDRFFDLVRQGRAGEVLRAVGKQFVDGVHEVFPIPAAQIALSSNVLTQNPGY